MHFVIDCALRWPLSYELLRLVGAEKYLYARLARRYFRICRSAHLSQHAHTCSAEKLKIRAAGAPSQVPVCFGGALSITFVYVQLLIFPICQFALKPCEI